MGPSTGSLLARKCARDLQHRLRVLMVLDRTMSMVNRQWVQRIREQELLIKEINREEKAIALEEKAMKQRSKIGRATRISHTRKPPSTSFCTSSRQRLVIPVTQRKQKNASDEGFERFVAMGFASTKVLAPDITEAAWRVLAAEEWSMKSSEERALYATGHMA